MFINAEAEKLIGNELVSMFRAANLCVANVEAPLVDMVSPINKFGPCLSSSVAAAAGISGIGVKVAALANNHIMDHGEQGLLSTVRALKEHGIACLGVGENQNEAAMPCIVQIGEKRIGIYACVEHEFSCAGEGTSGANPFDMLESPDHVAALKQACDYLIVLYHGGKEYYQYPSPMLQKVCRKLVDKGADLVLCQHSHCIGCKEEYKDSVIVYGQGNFLFDCNEHPLTKTGLIVRIKDDFSIDYIPVEKTDAVVRMAKGKTGEEILLDFLRRSEEIKLPGFIDKQYAAFADKMIVQYVVKMSLWGDRLLFKIVNRLTNGRYAKMKTKAFLRKKGLRVSNYIECEAHRELLLKGLSR